METLPAAQPAMTEPTPGTVHTVEGPVPMSFPAILRTPGLSDRYAHLRTAADSFNAAPPVSALSKNSRDEKEGKRWVRRKENARFVGNVHIVLPSKQDYAVPTPSAHPTFPEPLPHYLSRNNAVPPATIPAREPNSANAGRFSLSLKGMRRGLRKSGPRTELLVREVEGELVAWLRAGGVVLAPDVSTTPLSFPGVPVGCTDSIREVSRTPLQIVWWITDDAFTRYVVHCCARYHDVVSFSKDTSGERLTYLLRPNVTRPNYRIAAALDTPPTTDLDSEFVSESDLLSDRESLTDSDADGHASGSAPANTHAAQLAAIAESGASAPPSPALRPVSAYTSDDTWSVVGDTDADDDSEAEPAALAAGARVLTLHDADTPPRVPVRQASLRSHVWERQRRSASSPSRSSSRRVPQRVYPRVEPPRVEKLNSARSFYEYLFG